MNRAQQPGSATYRPPANLRGKLDGSVHNVNLPMLKGDSVKFGDMVGSNKVVLVNFWATWCGPCRREIPDLIALHNQFKDKGVEIVGLTVEDPQMERGRVEMFVQQFAMNYRVGFSPRDMFTLFNVANGNDPRMPIPQTFIFKAETARSWTVCRVFDRTFANGPKALSITHSARLKPMNVHSTTFKIAPLNFLNSFFVIRDSEVEIYYA
jgi:Thiol-disulfide isomerase and thioredoxins